MLLSRAFAAAILGLAGIQHLAAAQAAPIFAVLLILALFSSAVSVAAIIPGSRRILSPRSLLLTASAALLALFPLLFHDHAITNFVPLGIKCLTAGLAVAAPAGLLTWLVLRRGYAVDRFAAALAAGTLAGLSGITMLELHCPTFELFHILLWHTAVLPIAAILAAALTLRPLKK